MKIMILGAGQVGSTVAESLVGEANDITVVDSDGVKLRQLQDRLDLRTLTGNAAHPSVLEQAGIADTDMLLAVTQSDEVNLVACKLAASLYNTPTRIARIRATEYLNRAEVFHKDNFSVDFSISKFQLKVKRGRGERDTEFPSYRFPLTFSPFPLLFGLVFQPTKQAVNDSFVVLFINRFC